MSYYGGRQNSRGNNGYGGGQNSRGNNGYVPVYTDGACPRNGQEGARAGMGVYWGPNDPRNVSEPVYGRQTNNTAEIQAATRAIGQARDQGIRQLEVRTDSQFLADSANKWMGNWERNGWKTSSGGDVKNKEDFQQMRGAMDGMDVKFSHTPGHSGVEGNEAADRLARAGASGGRSNTYY